MLIEDIKKLPPFGRLRYWITERESVYLKKESGEPKPWTDDIILQSYRFCNIRRMDDKVSRWLLKKWYEPYRDYPNMLVACALARFINLPSSLELIGFPEDWMPEYIKGTLRCHKERGNIIFNGAYMVRGNDGQDKLDSVVDYYVDPLYRNKVAKGFDYTSMERATDLLAAQYGFGTFMAGQIIADMRWGITYNPNPHRDPEVWRDRYEWAAQGPGSTRGLNRVMERDPKTPIKGDQFIKKLREVVANLRKELPPSITGKMEMHDWQNTCCEYDKYERALWEEGRPKARYPGLK